MVERGGVGSIRPEALPARVLGDIAEPIPPEAHIADVEAVLPQRQSL